MTNEEARDFVIQLLVFQGADPAWCEKRIGEASYKDGELRYEFRPDEPVKFLRATFEVTQ